MKEVYLTTAGRIRYELQELNHIVERTERIWQRANQSNDDYYVDAAALNLHGFYTGIERILLVIAESIDQVRPHQANWHQELLRQMVIELSGIRPPVLSTIMFAKLDGYRGFRHVVRNVYTFNLDRYRIEHLVEELQPTMEQFTQELQTFAHVLEQLANGK